MASQPIVAFDYDFSPYGQKIRSALAASNVAFLRADVPPVLPRPTLEKLGITYRRIPVLAIGKDVYCDSSLIIDTIQKTFKALPSHPADKAFETFGSAGLFGSALNVIPTAALTPEFLKDRETIFPDLARPDYAELRPSGLAEIREQFQIIESQFLAASGGAFIGGNRISLADVHVGFVVKWLFGNLELSKEVGFGAAEFPLIHQWLDSWPKWTYTDISAEQAIETITKAEYSAKDSGVNENDYIQIPPGTKVTIENSDTKAGAHLQVGRLVGLNDLETVIELENTVRVHFPRRGYYVKRA
ncbi:hypothetical protein EJ05DRAFT_474778 [Pseudovirgaria hyperparasitica]|uniref:GST N-terminal domain-containing protein n=1 Tax=Pseudovirgaria hyperparasitica TaxID=470096 RepID=A0A6A6WAL4_9PEZI|nr:uncharacterized protein EJ05DRAFT_474778 [Pseudovirgaria hyperparasitica]KAF2759713.1 hypothetical protein EJ05DRAFT_474778 [Pseudovirgaria hyperparasitica]